MSSQHSLLVPELGPVNPIGHPCSGPCVSWQLPGTPQLRSNVESVMPLSLIWEPSVIEAMLGAPPWRVPSTNTAAPGWLAVVQDKMSAYPPHWQEGRESAAISRFPLKKSLCSEKSTAIGPLIRNWAAEIEESRHGGLRGGDRLRAPEKAHAVASLRPHCRRRCRCSKTLQA